MQKVFQKIKKVKNSGKTRQPLPKIVKHSNALAANHLSVVKRPCSNLGNLRKSWGNNDLREIPSELLHLIFVQLMQRDKNKLSESLIKGHKLSSVNAWLTLRCVESAAVCWHEATPVCRLFPLDRWRTAAAHKYKQTNKQASERASRQARKKKKKKRGSEGRGAAQCGGGSFKQTWTVCSCALYF